MIRWKLALTLNERVNQLGLVIAGRRDRGTVLIAAMVVIFALASMVLVLGQSVRVEATAAANRLAQQQASAAARGAEQMVLALISDYADALDQLDERTLEAVPVGSGYFWIIRPHYDDPDLPQYGLVDESTRIDLNAPVETLHDMLMDLPGMTVEIADAIVEWRGEDSTGIAGQSYLMQPEPYRIKSGPFETVEELLMIRGMTRELLYGAGQGSQSGRAGSRMSGAGTGMYYQTRGLFDYLTVWNRIPVSAVDGTRRVSINSQQQRSRLRNLIRERLGEERGGVVIRLIPSRTMTSIFDFAVATGLKSDELAQLEDYITADTRSSSRRGKINVNSAPRDVLLTIPNMTSSDVEAMLSQRLGNTAANSIAWVLNALPQERVVEIGPHITGRGQRHSAEIVAVSGDGRAFKRVRVVVHRGTTTRRIIYRRDITDMGWPLDANILASLRAGQRLARW